nr:uncharacterized protein LOC106731944 isoform X1 [Pelodiscus sinensis]XP_014428515.1 uncharacterized protein LOC106731944 isoform X3 [Pelodiscus sinensis]XP_025039837.1 uncharacterized protein LOC106731944 isoform X2 [Pelodiscus sinensis]|eukprot:XP_014428514.1 uncharacterized protein LOC106731944 isoform X1 [Pelodiscus sinensis]
METDPGSSRPQPPPAKTEIQNGYFGLHHLSTTQSGLVCIPQSTGCILPYCRPSSSQEISTLYRGQRSLPIRGAPLWPIRSPTSVFEDPGSRSCVPSSSRHHHLSLARRLPPHGPLDARGRDHTYHYKRYLRDSWTNHQSTKIFSGPGPVHRIHWSQTGFYNRYGVPTHGQSPRHPRPIERPAYCSGSLVPYLPEAVRPHGLHYIRHSAHSPSYAVPATLASGNLQTRYYQYQQAHACSCPRQGLGRIVAPPCQYSCWCPLPGSTPVNPAYHGCISCKLWSTYTTTSGSRLVVPPGIPTPYKLPGAQSSFQRLPPLRPPDPGNHTTGPYGQHMHCILHQSTGRSQIQDLVCGISALWNWAIRHSITLTASYLPGKVNTIADALSRSFQSQHEWGLLNYIAHDLFQLWGYPEIDLFATRDNKKCRAYCSRAGIGSQSIGDAFLLNWGTYLLYAFPLIPLIPRVIGKILSDAATVILVAPFWPRQTWLTQLMQMSLSRPQRLPQLSNLISQQRGNLLHPNIDRLHLTAWLLTGSKA